MPITFDYLMVHWNYEYVSDKVEEFRGHNYRLIVMADTYPKFIEELKKYGVYEEWLNKQAEETLKEPDKIGQLSMEDFL